MTDPESFRYVANIFLVHLANFLGPLTICVLLVLLIVAAFTRCGLHG